MFSQDDVETEKPARRRPRPNDGDRQAGSAEYLSPEQRIRAVFGQVGDRALPRVSEESLGAYHEYLGEQLSFPFVARYWEEVNPLEGVGHIVTVESLVCLQKRRPDVASGLFCVARLGERTLEVPLAELELGSGSANARLVEDYWYWFWNWRPDQR